MDSVEFLYSAILDIDVYSLLLWKVRLVCEQLLYFSAVPNSHEGFLRALSVASGCHMPRLQKPLPVSITVQGQPERATSVADR